MRLCFVHSCWEGLGMRLCFVHSCGEVWVCDYVLFTWCGEGLGMRLCFVHSCGEGLGMRLCFICTHARKEASNTHLCMQPPVKFPAYGTVWKYQVTEQSGSQLMAYKWQTVGVCNRLVLGKEKVMYCHTLELAVCDDSAET